MIKNFRTFNLSVEFCHDIQSLKLPRHLKDQLDRASSSIALNLAEGFGKSSYKDQRKYFQIAMGSLREVQAILILSKLKESKYYHSTDHLGASLYKLIKFKF